MRSLALKLIVLLTTSTTIVRADGLITEFTHEPSPNVWVVYYDAEFLFLARNFGSPLSSGARVDLGLFVHSKRHNRWLWIKKLSTVGAKFGRSQSENPDEQAVLSRLSVGWDDTRWAAEKQVELPLPGNASLALPDRIEFDEHDARYRLRFHSRLKIPVAETMLVLSRDELLGAFAEPATPVPVTK